MRSSAIFLLFLLSLTPAVHAAPLEISIEGETLRLNTDGREWTLASENHAGDRGVLEYVPPGENAANWSEMVTLNYFKRMKGADLIDRFVGFTKGGLTVRCQKFDWKELERQENSLLYAWTAQSCQGAPDQSEIARAVAGKEGLYVLHYASKKIPMPSKNKEIWQKQLSEASLNSELP